MLLERERTGGTGDTPPHTPLSSTWLGRGGGGWGGGVKRERKPEEQEPTYSPAELALCLWSWEQTQQRNTERSSWRSHLCLQIHVDKLITVKCVFILCFLPQFYMTNAFQRRKLRRISQIFIFLWLFTAAFYWNSINNYRYKYNLIVYTKNYWLLCKNTKNVKFLWLYVCTFNWKR